MKRTINEYEFTQAFIDADRAANFSYEARKALFEYFEQYEEETGEEIELDVIAICCEFYEEHWQDIADNYGIDLSDCQDDEDKKEAVADYINYHGYGIVGFTDNDNIVYQTF